MLINKQITCANKLNALIRYSYRQTHPHSLLLLAGSAHLVQLAVQAAELQVRDIPVLETSLALRYFTPHIKYKSNLASIYFKVFITMHGHQWLKKQNCSHR